MNWSNITNLDGAGVFTTVNRHLPPLVTLLLVVLVGWQAAKIVWLLVPGAAAGTAVTVPASASQPGQESGISADVQAIAATHIFGVADAEDEAPVIAVQSDADLEDTNKANLTLKGTVASALPEFSVALISDSGNDQEVYAIGDSIDSGTKLHAVYSDRVVLDEKGALTNLKLPREFTAAAVRNVRRATTRRRASTNSASIQNVVSQNLTKLTDVIRPTPYLKGGQPAGYRVYPGRDRKQFAALGLRPGDIITDIDGQSLTDPTQAIQIFQSLGTAEQVTVTVERNGQAQSLILKTSQLELGGDQTK